MSKLRDIMGLPPKKVGVTEDVARSVVSQGTDAVADMAGSLGDTHNRANAIAAWAAEKLGASPDVAKKIGYGVATGMFPLAAFMPDSETTRAAKPEAMDWQSQTPAGDIAGRAAYNIPATAVMPGGTILNKALSVAGSAFGGFAGKEGTSKLVDALENWAPNQKDTIEKYRPYAEAAGDFVGNVAGSFAPSAVQKAVTPNPMTPERINDARILDQHGVEMTAGQRTGNEALHAAEAQTGGSAYWNTRQRQNRQYTAGGLEDAGIRPRRPGGPRPDVASPDVLNHQHDILGAEFDRLQGHGMIPDTPFFEDLVQLRDDYRATMPRGQPGAPLIENTIRELSDRARRGIPVDGEYLRKVGTMLRSKLRSFRGSGRSDEADTISNLIEAIDNNVERSLAQTAPDEVGRYRDVRTRYRNLITVEEAASSAPNGQLSPADLTRATKKMETRTGYSRGFGPFNNYSRAGHEILRDPPNSGTPSRLIAALGGKGLNNSGAIIGGGIGSVVGGLPGAGVGAVIGAGADAAFRLGKNYLRMTPPMQAYLANQLARGWTPGVGAGSRAGAIGATTAQRLNKEKR